ncbi:MAG: SDR family NAD(P)-dependent oxidoreductase [Sphingopyxis sp.]
MHDLDGRTIFVTGGGNGLGRAHCRHLAGLGARVVVADRDVPAAEMVAAEIVAAGGSAKAAALDVADEASVANAFATAVAAFGDIDVLVNNAGGVFAPITDAENITLADWNRVMAINLTGPWLCARAVIPAMKRRRAGRIVNISSTSLSQGLPTELVPYITSKGGVVGLTRSLARELGPHGITVNAVAPGYVPKRAEMVHAASSLGMDKRNAIKDMVVGQQCIPRSGEPGDIVGAVAFLASDASGFMTGQVMNVDGGWALV